MTTEPGVRTEPEPEPDAVPGEIADEAPALPDQHAFYKMPTKFGHIPVAEEPLGWDPKRRFEHLYPHVRLPAQVVERYEFGHPELAPNRLYFGDNLHVMRSLPSESLDLIYIDPPFFSQQNYNVLFGDQNELRSFKDIWEGGLNGYLVWLNARLYEMKRLLRPTGTLVVHLDWHASHYVKVELDKLFGVNNLVSEIIWHYGSASGGRAKANKPVKSHDTLFAYARTYGQHVYNKLFTPYSEKYVRERFTFEDEKGRYRTRKRADGTVSKQYLKESPGVPLASVWTDIKQLYAMHLAKRKREEIGYPTQKPEALVERIIAMASNAGDVVADFFVGGGTTAAVAQRLGRRWIAADISRVAVSITADRVAKVVEQQQADAKATGKQVAIPAFEVAHWGIYEIAGLSKMTEEEFRQFILLAYEAREDSTEGLIHGYKGQEPIHVGSPDPDKAIRKEEIAEFANAVLARRGSGGSGTVIAWSFSEAARKLAERIAARQKVQLQFVKLKLVPIESPEFAAHVSAKHERYVDLISFVLPPSIRIRHERIGSRAYRFDASESVPLNQGARLINAQWDFDYRGFFTSTQGYELKRTKKGEPVLTVEYEFPKPGRYEIAVRVQDDLGGEALHRETVEVT